MRNYNYVLVVGTEDSRKMRTITEALEKRYWGYIEYIDSYYKASGCELPDIIIYEPNKRNRTLIADQGFRSEMAKRTPKVWLVGNEKALDEALTEWWLKVNCGE